MHEKTNLDNYASFIYNKSIKIKKGQVTVMTVPDKLRFALEEKGGVITTAQANEVGISNERLRLLEESGDLERVNFGVYALPGEFVDRMYIVQLRRPKIIYSHETALYLHDLTDRDPFRYSVTVPTGYNAQTLREDGFDVYMVKKELHQLGIIKLPTVFGNLVTAYNLERTICDCLRSRNQMDMDIVIDGIKRYAKRSDKNLNTLMEMSKTFGVSKILQNYIEVLL